MIELDSKSRLLEGSGYRYNFHRAVYFNPDTRKVFSAEFIDDHAPDEIAARMEEPRNGDPGAVWRFYFNSPPPESVRLAVERALDIG